MQPNEWPCVSSPALPERPCDEHEEQSQAVACGAAAKENADANANAAVRRVGDASSVGFELTAEMRSACAISSNQAAGGSVERMASGLMGSCCAGRTAAGTTRASRASSATSGDMGGSGQRVPSTRSADPARCSPVWSFEVDEQLRTLFVGLCRNGVATADAGVSTKERGNGIQRVARGRRHRSLTVHRVTGLPKAHTFTPSTLGKCQWLSRGSTRAMRWYLHASSRHPPCSSCPTLAR